MIEINISDKGVDYLIDTFNSEVKDYKNFEVFIIFKSDFSQSKIIRDFVYYIFGRLYIDRKQSSRFVLLSDELVNNAIEHGSDGNKSSGIFKIKIESTENKINLNIEVTSTGKEGKKVTASDMQKIREEKLKKGFDKYESIRGRGLFLIIEQIVDKLYFKDTQKGLLVGVNKLIEIE